MLRRVLFALALTAALALSLEMAVTYLAQRGMEEALERQYGLHDGLRVRINSFPLIVSLAKNHIRDLRLEWTGDLCLSTEERSLPVPAVCDLRMNDVELDMAAVFGGRLEIRSLSRLSSVFRIPLAGLEPLLGGVATFSESEGMIGVDVSGLNLKYEVYISGEDRMTFRPHPVSKGMSGQTNESKPYIDSSEITVSVGGFPMRFALLSASVEGDQLSMKVVLEEWEGYLDASIGSL